LESPIFICADDGKNGSKKPLVGGVKASSKTLTIWERFRERSGQERERAREVRKLKTLATMARQT
jgi:hypothetical protein